MKRRPPTVTELFECQYALASDAQLTAAGVTPFRLKCRLDDGDWRRPCPGVVQLVGAPPDWRQTPMAVTLGARRSAVGVGAGVRIHGLDGFAEHEPIDAFVERGARRSLPAGVIAHSSRRLKTSDITTVAGIRVECQSWDWHSTRGAIQHDVARKRRLRALGWEIVEMWWSDLERVDVVLADFEIGRERQRRLGTATG